MKTFSAIVGIAIIMLVCMFYIVSAIPNEPIIVPCDTDMDCMEKNPHIEFSLLTAGD